MNPPVTRALQQYSRLAVRAGGAFELALCHGTVCTLAFGVHDGNRRGVPNDLGLESRSAVAEAQRLRPDWVNSGGRVHRGGQCRPHAAGG